VPAAEVDSGLFLVSYQTIKIHVAARSQECLNRPTGPLPLSAQARPNQRAAKPPANSAARQLSLALESLTRGPPSRQSPRRPSFPLFLFPFRLPQLTPAGAAVVRWRPCGHVRRRGWPPRGGRSISPFITPTSTYLSTAASIGLKP
jgi:hypothetical protein